MSDARGEWREDDRTRAEEKESFRLSPGESEGVVIGLKKPFAQRFDGVKAAGATLFLITVSTVIFKRRAMKLPVMPAIHARLLLTTQASVRRTPGRSRPS